MSRVVDDQVFVRTRAQRSGRPDDQSVRDSPCTPEQFIWRDRLYVVQGVLEHWRERQAWWARPAALAVHGATAPATAVDLATATDRQLWRVSAAAGRRAPAVFELCADGTGPAARWRLLRVDD